MWGYTSIQTTYVGILSSGGLNVSNQGPLPVSFTDTAVCTNGISTLMHVSERAKPSSSFGRRSILPKLCHLSLYTENLNESLELLSYLHLPGFLHLTRTGIVTRS